jgi:outer membrane lipoprotein SlyB
MKTLADRSSCFHRAGTARGLLTPLITVIVVVLLSSAALVRMMGWGPNSAEDSGGILALDQSAPVPAANEARVEARCPECGVIVSMREIEVRSDDASPGATGEAVAGGQSGTRVISPRTYEVAVRMADGSSRVFNDTSPARWRLGERMILIEGASRPNR